MTTANIVRRLSRNVLFLNLACLSFAHALNAANAETMVNETRDSKNSSKQVGSRQGGKVVKFKDVESLNDDLVKYEGRMVSVIGAVQDRVDERAFVLASGGLLNDEIVVLMDKSLKSQVEERKTIEVVGVIRTLPLDKVKESFGWDLNPQTRTRLQRVKTFLVAQQLTPVVNQ